MDLLDDEQGTSDWDPAVVTNGAGTWIAATSSGDKLGTFTSGRHIAFSRSTDGGLTYSSRAPLGGGSSPLDEKPTLAGDASGRWIAAWTANNLGSSLYLSRSTDDGVTWSPAVFFYGDARDASIATDGAGTWVAVWQQWGGDRDVYFSRSTDGGSIWSAPVVLNAESVFDPKQDYLPKLYVSGGVWIAVWQAYPYDHGIADEDRDVLYARSLDGGATWSLPAPLSTTRYADHQPDLQPRLASDGAGNWVAVWHSENPLGSASLEEGDILFARSSDHGATWSAPAALNTDAAVDNAFIDDLPAIAANPSGTFVATWRRYTGVDIGFDADILTATSEDGGATWSSPAHLVAMMATDEEDDYQPLILWDPAGRWLAAWTTQEDLVAWPPDQDHRLVTAFSDEPCGNGVVDPGEACDDGVRAAGDADCCGRTCQYAAAGARCASDGDACTYDRCDGAGTCLHVEEPRPVCNAPVAPSASALQIGVSANPAKNKLDWKLAKGPAATFDDFGRPQNETTISLCVYDGAGLLARADAPFEDNGCGAKSCWDSHKGKDDYDGWDYKDPFGTPNGIAKMQLRASGAGKTKLSLKAKGANVVPAALPATGATVTAQLIRDEEWRWPAQCYGASYATAASKNTGATFKGKGQ